MNYILITGTGRSGTSCFAKLLNACFPDYPMPGAGDWRADVDAGYEGWVRDIIGDETYRYGKTKLAGHPMFLKDPRGSAALSVLADLGRAPRHVFICYRNPTFTAASRMNHQMQTYDAIERSGVSFLAKQDREQPQEAAREIQLVNDHLAISMMMSAVWDYDIPHSVLKFPDFVEDGEALYRQVNKVLPIRSDIFMRKHADIMDPAMVNFR